MKLAAITKIIRISRNVVDLDRSIAFYQDRLGFQVCGPAFIMEPALAAELGFGARYINVQRLQLGEEELELVEAGPNVRPYPSPSTSADLVFQHLAVRCLDIDASFKRLYRKDSDSVLPTAISRNPSYDPTPIRLPVSSGGVTAFKFRDPDGHPLELLQPARHKGARSTVCAGIDHTAISISSTASSIAFYEDLLGLTVSAYETNSGSEQGSLDALESPIVDVVALQTKSQLSPHLELLSYRRPIASAYHARAEPADIVGDRIVIRCSDVRSLATELGIASRIVRSASGRPALLFRDPNDHLLWAIE
ncbi:Glyoxalase-like domain protein [Caballeronia sordidicola]|uniref:Glyoxalase-like domain protein n=1 Tax=Caballeronia sordidicola TaxID=196367 RepID=A0A158EP94_CABSO|nr:VOC family protein [Caballeronia sordidicola]SAL09402.1 Glyoxalase-like domain protein [Caballeronia sordidicola]